MRNLHRIFAAAGMTLLLAAFSTTASAQTVRASSSGAKTTTTGSSQAGRLSVDRKETSVSNSNVTNKGLTTVRTTSTPVRSGSSTQTSGSATRTSSSTATSTTRPSGTSTATTTSTTRTSGTTSTTTRPSGTSTATTATQTSTGTPTRPSNTSQTSGTAVRTGSSTTSTAQTATTKPATTTTQSTSQSATASNQSGSAVRSNSNVTVKTQNTGRPERNETYTDRGGNFRYGGANNMQIYGDNRDVQRTHPMDRPPVPYSAPAPCYAKKPHYYGYTLAAMPHGYVVKTYWGREFISYNNVWYTRVGNVYRVCRPPYGTEVRFGLCKHGLTSVRFSYYNSIDRAYSAINQNYAIIAEQNRIIAQNNAIIAQQNARLALNNTSATAAYLLAAQLGLIQSYGSATTNYFYQDGVFYTGTGRYLKTVMPPAGAIIASLPEDYIIVSYGGDPFYRVENTLYRQFVVDGAPYFEVLGQFPY